MDKKIALVVVAVAALIAGVLLSGAIASYAVNGNHTGMVSMYAMHRANNETTNSSSASSMSMDDMTNDLKGKAGDAFDRAFVSEMIVHHQGAINMANLAKTNVKHQEIKGLPNNIITAQTNEIHEMKNWQSEWGYSSSNTMMNSHNMMGM